jgi:hypothetical protein
VFIFQEAVTDADSLTVDAISCGEKIENWIAGLEQELELVSQDKANIIRKEEAIHTNIQVRSGTKLENSMPFQFSVSLLFR